MTDAEMDALAGAGGEPPKTLSDADMDAVASSAPSAPAVPETRSFLQRGVDSLASGAGAIKHVIGQGIHEAGQRMAGAFGLEHEAPPTQAQAQARIRELTGGVGDVVTLGYGNKLAARIGNALGDTPENSLDETKRFSASPTTGDTHESSMSRARDAELAGPDYRTVGQIGGSMLPGAGSAVAGVGGKVVGALAKPLEPVARSFLAKAGSVPLVGPALAAGSAGLAGAAKSVAGYEASAPLSAALSADAEGHRHEAAHEAMTDPAGLIMSAAGGGVPAFGNEAGSQAKKYIDQAPESADAWLIKDLRGQHKGETTPTARKYLAADEKDVLATVNSDPVLKEALTDARHSDRAKLETAAEAVQNKINEVTAPRETLYDEHVNKALGGGVRAGDVVKSIRDLAEEHSADGEKGGHKIAKFLNDQADILERSRNWGAKPVSEGSAVDPDLAELQSMRAGAKSPMVQKAIDDQIAQLAPVATSSQRRVFDPDTIVPIQKLRKVVTDIQNEAYDGLGGLASTRASTQARIVAGDAAGILNSHLDRAAAVSPQTAEAVQQIRDMNTQYSALKNIQRVIEQRVGKATENASGAGGIPEHIHGMGRKLMNAGGLSGAATAAALGHPGVAAATLAIPAAVEAKRFVDSKAAKLAVSPGYPAAVARLAQLARSATSGADFVAQATRAGMGVAAARRIYEAAHPTTNAPGLIGKFGITGSYPGLVEGGNIDLTNRPDVANADGSHSSVRSMSFEDNGKEILVPTVSEDGRIMSDDEAIDQYRRTGRHLGKFKTPDAATAYAEALHNQQAASMPSLRRQMAAAP